MKKALLLLLLCIPGLPALALDASSAVQVKPLLRTSSSWDGKPVVYPSGKGEATMLMIEIAPGGETGWHEHGVPSFAYLLEGNLEVTLADGKMNRLGPGDALAEVVGVIHNGRVLGEAPVKILVLYTGAVGLQLTIAHPEFKPAPRP